MELYFRRVLATNGGAGFLQEGAALEGARQHLEAAASHRSPARLADAMEKWLTEWVTPAARQKCLRALHQASHRERKPAPKRRPVDGKTWSKLLELATHAGVDSGVALDGLVDFVRAEPARQRAAERFLQLRATLAQATPQRRRSKP